MEGRRGLGMATPWAAWPSPTPTSLLTRAKNLFELKTRRLKRLEEMKLLEANGAKVIDAKPQPVETKPVFVRTNDRRFRRF